MAEGKAAARTPAALLAAVTPIALVGASERDIRAIQPLFALCTTARCLPYSRLTPAGKLVDFLDVCPLIGLLLRPAGRLIRGMIGDRHIVDEEGVIASDASEGGVENAVCV